MPKKHYLDKENYLQILRSVLISEIKNEEMVDFLVLLISNDVRDLEPLFSEKKLFKESVRKAIVFWKETSEDQNIKKLKSILVGLFVKKTSNKFFEFLNKIQILLSIVSLIFSAIAMFR